MATETLVDKFISPRELSAQQRYTRAVIVNHPERPGIRVGFVRTDSVIIDRSYQRDEAQFRINAMAADWDDQKAGAVTIADRADRRVALDGQQRIMAARQAGITWLPAVFLDVEDVPGEADLFVSINRDRRSLTALALYKAELVAGYPEALDIEGVVRSYGLRVGKVPQIAAVNALRTVYRLGTLDQTIKTILTAWPLETTDGRFVREIIIALGSFLRTYRKADQPRLARLIGEVTPAKLHVALLSATHRPTAGETQRAHSAQINMLVDIYNKQLRGRGRLDHVKPMAHVPFERPAQETK